ncbi:MAG TPA: helix-turn-helix transcriptional regulator [Stellaceae bacterium]|nr:helix-turn-helix transcriptional regulator [Stellaceae bacterium]
MARSRTFQQPGRDKGLGPDPIDVQVGSRVRLRRNMLGLSQEKLGDALGLTFQQVQKYERGANRVSASRLYQLSRVLDVPVRFFYDQTDPVRAPAIPGGFAEPPAASYQPDPLRNPETLELIDAYFAIGDPGVRQRLYQLAKALGSEVDGPDAGAAAPRRRRRQHRA